MIQLLIAVLNGNDNRKNTVSFDSEADLFGGQLDTTFGGAKARGPFTI